MWNSSHIWPKEWGQGGKVGMERTNGHYVRHCARPSSYIRPLNLHSSNIIIFFLHKRKQTQKSYMTCWDSNSEMLDSKTMRRSPGEGDGNPLQYSCLENSMDRGSWWTTVHGVTKKQWEGHRPRNQTVFWTLICPKALSAWADAPAE